MADTNNQLTPPVGAPNTGTGSSTAQDRPNQSQGGNGSVPTDQDNNNQVQLNSLLATTRREGRNAERNRVRSLLRDAGYEIDQKTDPFEFIKTVLPAPSGKQGKSNQSQQQQNSEESLLAKQLELERKAHLDADARANRVTITRELEKAAGIFDFVDLKARHDALVSIKDQYTLELDEDGETVKILTKNGEKAIDPKTYRELSLEDVIDTFLDEHPWFIKGKTKTVSKTGSQRGVEQEFNMDDMIRRGVKR